MTPLTAAAVNDERTAELLMDLPMERVRDEVMKMFSHDTLGSMELLEHGISRELRDAIFRNNALRLMPTMKKGLLREAD
jgi:hypothetical protein